ncbi:PREDICTED: uncharacterized protein LOC102004635 [Chinchilla lanigera]|uniref:uncharacterized protein LOC102004635 n=1 Tax=Chinchilla lanigera TaxID=34839 RepID=UPI0006964209|nr:PREDICTED: uncharacterized protein LOC102004635 [Chinchilla lanigera]
MMRKLKSRCKMGSPTLQTLSDLLHRHRLFRLLQPTCSPGEPRCYQSPAVCPHASLLTSLCHIFPTSKMLVVRDNFALFPDTPAAVEPALPAGALGACAIEPTGSAPEVTSERSAVSGFTKPVGTEREVGGDRLAGQRGQSPVDSRAHRGEDSAEHQRARGWQGASGAGGTNRSGHFEVFPVSGMSEALNRKTNTMTCTLHCVLPHLLCGEQKPQFHSAARERRRKFHFCFFGGALPSPLDIHLQASSTDFNLPVKNLIFLIQTRRDSAVNSGSSSFDCILFSPG